MQTRSPPATALDRAPYRDQVKNGKGCANRTAIHLRDWLPRCDNPVRVQRTVPVVSPWFRGRALCVGSLHRWTRHLSVAARQTPPCSATASAGNQCCVEIVPRRSPFGANVCNWDGFSGMASEERRCFGVRAAERSVDAALVVPEEANPLPPIQHLNPLHCKP